MGPATLMQLFPHRGTALAGKHVAYSLVKPNMRSYNPRGSLMKRYETRARQVLPMLDIIRRNHYIQQGSWTGSAHEGRIQSGKRRVIPVGDGALVYASKHPCIEPQLPSAHTCNINIQLEQFYCTREVDGVNFWCNVQCQCLSKHPHFTGIRSGRAATCTFASMGSSS